MSEKMSEEKVCPELLIQRKADRCVHHLEPLKGSTDPGDRQCIKCGWTCWLPPNQRKLEAVN